MLSKSTHQNQRCEITPARRAILEYLADHRFATTGQLYQELQMPVGLSRKHTDSDLRSMGRAGLVKYFLVDPHKGNKSEYGWLITRKGVEAVGREFATKYRRQPSRERLKLRHMELELLRAISFAGGEETSWSAIEPLVYSPSHPLPATTPQHDKLVEAVDFVTAAQLWADLMQGRVKPDGQFVTNFRQAQQQFSIPSQVNDYVVFSHTDKLDLSNLTPLWKPGSQLWGNNKLLSVLELMAWAAQFGEHYTEAGRPIQGTVALVIILCPPKAGPRFWASKLTNYTRLARLLPVYGVFETEEARRAGENQLNQLAQSEHKKWIVSGHGAHFNTLTLAGIYELLEGITAKHDRLITTAAAMSADINDQAILNQEYKTATGVAW